MEDKAKKEEDLKNLSNKIKMIFLIYDYVRSSSKNINEFNISKIVLTRDIKKKTFEEVFNSYKNRSYNQSSNLNNKTLYFIDLMKNIMSYDYRPDVSNTQLLLTYDLVTIFHKGTSPEDVLKFQKSFYLFIIVYIKIYTYYKEILKNIVLQKEDNENNSDVQFLNKCKIIQNLNKFEFNSSLSTFLLLKESIPQFKRINFPKLDSKDNEKIYNEKIKNIAILFDVINSSFIMNAQNIRYELFQKYVDQDDNLCAINEVLTSLNKKRLKSLREDDLMQNIELQMENNSFLQDENKKGRETIATLKNEINKYKNDIQILNGNIQTLSQNLDKSKSKLIEEERQNSNLLFQLEAQQKNYKDLHNELQNIKYRDICSYIIDYFMCILNDRDYNNALNSTYRTAVYYILKEIGNDNYKNYRNILSKEGIIIRDLLNILLEHKLEYNSVTHDSIKKENDFIELINEFKNEETGKKFHLLFDKTPLLKRFCFVKQNGLTREQIKNAILAL